MTSIGDMSDSVQEPLLPLGHDTRPTPFEGLLQLAMRSAASYSVFDSEKKLPECALQPLRNELLAF